MNLAIEHKSGRSFLAIGSKGEFLVDENVATAQEYFVAGMLSCSGVDIVELAKKGGYEVSELKLSAEIERSQKKPNKFDTAHIIYSFNSNGDDLSARRWVLASLETYCTTINSIRDSVKIYYSIIHNNVEIAKRDEIVSGIHFVKMDNKYEDFGE